MSESLNLGTLRSQVETYLLNTSTDVNSLSWSVAEINGYLNEAVLYTQQVTLWYEDFDTILCTAGVSTYTADQSVYQFGRFTWDRSFLPQTNEYELDRDDPTWRSGATSGVTNNPFRFYFPQFGQQALIAPYPVPSQNGVSYAFSQDTGIVVQASDTSVGDGTFTFTSELGVVIQQTDTAESLIGFRQDFPFNAFDSPEFGELTVYEDDGLNIGYSFVRLPDTMVLDTDKPQLPVQCHLALVFYAVMKCFTREGEFQDLQLAQAWFAAYSDWLESVLENKARWWSTRVRTLEPFEEGSLFAKRLNAIGYPMQLDLKPSYGA